MGKDLKKCVHNWITWLYNRNEHNIVHSKYSKSTVLQLKIETNFRHGPLAGQLAVKTLHWWSGEDDSPGHIAVESWFEGTHDWDIARKWSFQGLQLGPCDSEVKWSQSRSVISDSLWAHGLYSPWNSPGQNTRVGSRSLLQGIFPTLDRTQVSRIAGGFLWRLLLFQCCIPTVWPRLNHPTPFLALRFYHSTSVVS